MKTKLLKEIAEQSETLKSLCFDLSQKLAEADHLDNSHWNALSHIISARNSLEQNVRLLEGSIRSFEELKKKTDLVRSDTQALHEVVNKIVEMMKEVSKHDPAHQ